MRINKEKRENPATTVTTLKEIQQQQPQLGKIIVSMIREYHNHTLQTNQWHCEEEPHNNHETPGRQTKQSNQLSLPHQDDCKTRRDKKKRTTKPRTITESHNGNNNKQQVKPEQLKRKHIKKAPYKYNNRICNYMI